MAENLIYGKNIADFGAVGDGEHDCTAAFLEAFSGSESLVSIPYGKYLIKSELVLGGNIKINCHPRAEIYYTGITAGKNARRICINGGIWICQDEENCAFDLTECSKSIIENAEIHTSSDLAVGICDSNGVIIENVRIYSENESVASGIMFGNSVRFTRIKNAEFFGCSNALEIGSGCDLYTLYADGIQCKDCETALFAKNCSLENSIISDISGNFLLNALHFEGAEISDTSVRSLNVCDGYIYAEDTTMKSLEIEGFRRLSDIETDTSKPSFVMTNCPESTLIFDGIPLDAIILAKKSVPDIKMTAAKMVSPAPTANGYTLELTVSRKDSFIIPLGGFDALSAVCSLEN